MTETGGQRSGDARFFKKRKKLGAPDENNQKRGEKGGWAGGAQLSDTRQ